MSSKPMTPTGKVWLQAMYPLPEVDEDDEERQDCLTDILAIEAEAAQQARALADELADRVNENAGLAHGIYAHPGAYVDCPYTPCCDDRAALAKWEASRE